MRVIELHAPVKVVQRSKGRSAVAAAAYRAGERLTDERTGLVHDYTRKQGIEGQTLILPDNAPAYAHDREKLWNAAEKNEKHPRAQTARDMTVAFPSEFSPEQRAEAGHRIGQWLMFRYGSAVDVALHEPSRKGDQDAQYRNYHAHMLFTTRRWDENGKWAKTKDRTLDDLQKGPDEVKALRLAVADVMNNIAARDKLDIYVEHLSFEERGLDREPTQHLGPMATQMERRGQPSDIGNANRAIQARNQKREELERENNIVDIEAAREHLRQKGKAPSLPPAQRAAYAAFYRESQTRRSAMLEDLERQHGQQERDLRLQSAQLNQSLTGANFFVRAWRFVSGRTRQEKEQLAQVTANLDAIRQRREAAHIAFEADRRVRMEAMVEQRRQQEERARSILYARAAGEERSPAPPRPLYEARRAAFMASRRVAAPTPEQQSEPEKVSPSRPPAPSKEPTTPTVKSRPDYEARRDAFFAGRRKQRQPEVSRDSTPQARTERASRNRDAARPSPENTPTPSTQTPESKVSPDAAEAEARRREYMERMRSESLKNDTGQEREEDGPSLER